MRDSRTVICANRFIFVSSDLQKFNLVYIYFVQRTVHTKFRVRFTWRFMEMTRSTLKKNTTRVLDLVLNLVSGYSCRTTAVDLALVEY